MIIMTSSSPSKISVDLQTDDFSSTADQFWKLYTEQIKREDSNNGPYLIQPGQLDYSIEREQGMTPLMAAVARNHIKTSFILLCFGADPNIQHRDTGNTALHIAVHHLHFTLVKLLLAFRSDPTIVNHHNMTPLDIITHPVDTMVNPTDDINVVSTSSTMSILGTIVNSFTQYFTIKKTERDDDHIKEKEEISQLLIESTKLHTKTTDYFSSNFSIPDNNNNDNSHSNLTTKDILLLSLDGGGTRALLTTLIMINIEQRLYEITQNREEPSNSSSKMCTYFDYIAGTSSGGMIACLLSYLEFDAHNVMAAMTQLIRVIESPPERRVPLMEESFINTFTQERTMDDLRGAKSSHHVIIMASSTECVPYELHLMASYGESKSDHNSHSMMTSHGESGRDHELRSMINYGELESDHELYSMTSYGESKGDRELHAHNGESRNDYNSHLIMTSSGKSKRDGVSSSKVHKVWEVCRIATTVPYFTSLFQGDTKLIDGGLVCNNPTLAAMGEIIRREIERGKRKLKCVVSIGTGIGPRELNTGSDMDLLFSSSLLSRYDCVYLINKLHGEVH